MVIPRFLKESLVKASIVVFQLRIMLAANETLLTHLISCWREKMLAISPTRKRLEFATIEIICKKVGMF